MADFEFITQTDIEQAEKEVGVPKFGPLGWITDYRTYRRYLPKIKRRETFFERNARTVNYNLSLALPLQDIDELKEEAELMYSFMNNFLAFPSGRTMWVGGTETSESNPACNFNCSFLAINRLSAFLTLFELLMVGTGVGFRVFEKDISQLPSIKKLPEIEFESYIPRLPQDRIEDSYYQEIDDGKTWKIYVGDSRKGWIDALEYFLECVFTDNGVTNIILNVDSIRPMGERINGFGGTASGPEALVGIIQNVHRVVSECPASKLRSIDCMDICTAVAKGVVAGSSRRSALICLFDQGDLLCANAKVNMPEHKSYRWQSNNTECVGSLHTNELKTFLESNPDSDLDTIIDFIDQFKPSLEWFEEKFQTIAASGEPGINNYLLMCAKRWLAVRKWRPSVAVDKIWDRYCDVGTNPCLTGDMRLQTDIGNLTFEELAERDDFKILSSNGEYVGTKVWCSGEKEVIAIRLSNGKILKSTPDHVWMTTEGELKAQDLKGKQLVPLLQSFLYDDVFAMYGFIQGDGNTSRLLSDKHLGFEVNIGDKDQDIYGVLTGLEWNYTLQNSGRSIYLNEPGVKSDLLELGFSTSTLPTRVLPTTYTDWDLNQKASFLCGLYSANGSVLKKAGRITLKSTSLELLEQVQDSLEKDFKIESYITTNKSKEVVFDNGCYLCRESYDLNICKFESKVTFFNNISFLLNYKVELLREVLLNTAPKVTSLKPLGIQKVYDFTEPLTHWGSVEGFLCHNCHEIILSAGYSESVEFIGKGVSFCNLTTTPLQNFVIDGVLDYKLLEKAVRLITRIGLRQTCVQMPTQELHETQIEERLLGVSATGWRKMMDMLGWQTAGPEIVELQKMMNKWANDEATNYAAKLGVPRPLLVTCIKPEGTSSKVFGSSDGLHWEWAPYYIRRIQMSTTDALAKALKTQGFIWHPVPYDLDKHVKGEDTWDRIKVFEAMSEVEKDELFVKSNAVQFSFPIKAETTISQGEVSAIEQLENVRSFAINYTDHLPSSTVTVKPDEWGNVANWVHSNWKDYITAAFLSYWSGNYPLLPYEDIDEETYNSLLSYFDSQYVTPTGFKVDESLVNKFELADLEEGVDIDDVDLGGGCDKNGCPIR